MKRILFRASIALLAFSAVAFLSLFIPLEKEKFVKENIHSLKVLDRNGKLLREFLNDEDGRGEWVGLADISPHVVDATISIEDKRFHRHPGIDPAAIARALVSQFLPGRRSGGSTVTQQVIRMVYRHPRTLSYKVMEAWYALRLERMMSKEQILEQYLNRAPYGNQLNGIQAASKYYFDKPAKDLSIAEAAFLAALPNAPTQLNPYKYHSNARKRQQKIIGHLFIDNKIARDEYERACGQKIPIVTPEKRFRAPHAVELMYSSLVDKKGLGTIQSTIDADLQTDVQWIITGHLSQLKEKNVTNAAVVILHNPTGEIRSLIGSANYFDEANHGQVNGAIALRQPGSAVKPLTYAIALESGFTPSTVLPDIPTALPGEGGNYVPQNYDREYHGPVRLRIALACSYNIPAVRLLYSIGKEALYDRMRSAGLTTLHHSPQHYGFGLTLGNAEVTLLEMTNAYRLFANNGVWSPVRLVRSIVTVDGKISGDRLPIERGERREVFSNAVAYLITDILKDNSARRPAFGNHFHFSFPCAVKTGTTKDYRDNWTVGYTPEYTVGIWVGNFNGEPMHQVSGVTGAGQIFSDIMNVIMAKYRGEEREFIKSDDLVRETICARSGNIPNGYCTKTVEELFERKFVPRTLCGIHKAYVVNKSSGEKNIEIFEVLPGEYDEWMAMENRSRPPEGSVEIRKGKTGKSTNEEIRILYPGDGDVFKIDPILRKEFQTLKVESAVSTTIDKPALLVDGKNMHAIDDNKVWWQLQKGRHTMQIVGFKEGKRVKSNKVTVIIE